MKRSVMGPALVILSLCALGGHGPVRALDAQAGAGPRTDEIAVVVRIQVQDSRGALDGPEECTFSVDPAEPWSSWSMLAPVPRPRPFGGVRDVLFLARTLARVAVCLVLHGVGHLDVTPVGN